MAIPTVWARIVKASRVLTAGEKLVWEEHRLLDADTGDGIYATARTIGERLGTSDRTIEAVRLQLVRYGLLVRELRAGGRSHWFVRLPPATQPESKSLTPAGVAAAAARLDAVLAPRRPPRRADRGPAADPDQPSLDLPPRPALGRPEPVGDAITRTMASLQTEAR